MNIYSVKDEERKVWNTPFIAEDDIAATRGFAIASSETQLQLSFFPDQFTLYKIAEINDETMVVESGNLQMVVGASSLKEVVEGIYKKKQEMAAMKRAYLKKTEEWLKKDNENKNKKRKWWQL